MYFLDLKMMTSVLIIPTFVILILYLFLASSFSSFQHVMGCSLSYVCSSFLPFFFVEVS